jgi:hypothetical protein
MRFSKSDVVTVYRESSEILRSATRVSAIRVFVYFLIRTQTACIGSALEARIDVRQIDVMLELSIVSDASLCARLAEQYSQKAQLSDFADSPPLLVVGFWSILSYWASFLLSSDIRYLHYGLDVFLAGIEEALAHSATKLETELENLGVVLNYVGANPEVVARVELKALKDWVESEPIGEHLKDLL